MKTGKSLTELAAEIERQHAAKKDYLADTRKLTLADDGRLILGNGDHSILNTNKNFHAQVAARLGIPKQYYDRMLEEQPTLLAKNVNTWFSNKPEVRMVRTLDGTARAFLSERYRPLDNFQLASAVLPVLQELGADVQSADVTENKLYLKAIIPGRLEQIPPAGVDMKDVHFDGKGHILVDEVQPGIVISNSEIGLGGVNVCPAIHEIHCTNLATWKKEGINKHHIGGALSNLLGEGQQLAEYMADDTRKATDEAIWKQVRDVCRAACDGQIFEKLVDRLREARGQKIEGDIPKVVEVTAEKYGFNNDERAGVLRHLIERGDLSKYGLHSAVTLYSQQVDDYDRATELEEVGAQVIELSQTEWNSIGMAA